MSVQLSDLIAQTLVAELETTFQDVDSNEQPGLIRAGKLQDNPTKHRIILLVHLSDPEKPGEWADSPTASRVAGMLDKTDYYIPTYEIGGGVGSEMWYRRGAVEGQVFLTKTKEDRDEARRIANVTRARVELCLSRSTKAVANLKDDFGEIGRQMLVINSRVTEGGGPPASFIWNFVVRWQALTHRAF